MGAKRDRPGRLVFVAEREHSEREYLENWWRADPLGAMLGNQMPDCATRRRLEATYGSRQTVVNLLPPSRDIGSWDARFARFFARQLADWVSASDRRLALLGRRVAVAFGFRGEFGTVYVGEPTAILLPHPSRAFNDQQHMLRSFESFVVHFCR